ncbi:MAG: transglutaminase domain-containing protein [Pirellulaceae bacterium]|nr:transglutaminase domain-containing protein [Pirellulaceae bacterium]
MLGKRIPWAAALFLLLLVGCGADPETGGQAGGGPTSQTGGGQASQAGTSGGTGQSSADPDEPSDEIKWKVVRDTWDASFIKNSKVGFSHVTIEQGSRGDQQFVRVKIADESEILRFGQRTKQRFEAECLENAAGQLVSFATQADAGRQKLKTAGEVKDARLVIRTDLGVQKQTNAIDWEPGWGGFFADARSLLEKPLEEGEMRTLKMLAPLVNEAATVELKAIGRGPTAMLDGSTAQLMEIATKTNAAKVTLTGTLWCDERGEILKSHNVTLDITTYRVTAQQARAKSKLIDFDLGLASIVPVAQNLTDAHQLKKATYRVKLERSDPAESFATGFTQRVRSIDKRTAEIVVESLAGDDEREVDPGGDEPPTAKELAANSFIQSTDGAVVEMASGVNPDEMDDWKLALALENHVHDSVVTKGFSQAFSPASDVVRSREGDCTEHAVLLAALCRARGVPARAVVGLVYVPAERGFAFHMWNEVWVNHRWVPLDAMLGRGGVGAARLKVAHTSLAGASPYAALLPVVPVLRGLSIEVLKTEP